MKRGEGDRARGLWLVRSVSCVTIYTKLSGLATILLMA